MKLAIEQIFVKSSLHSYALRRDDLHRKTCKKEKYSPQKNRKKNILHKASQAKKLPLQTILYIPFIELSNKKITAKDNIKS